MDLLENENGILLINDGLTEHEDTCIFEQKKGTRNFTIRLKTKYRKNDERSVMSPPSIDLSSPNYNTEDNEPVEVRFIRSVFDNFQEFVETMGE